MKKTKLSDKVMVTYGGPSGALVTTEGLELIRGVSQAVERAVAASLAACLPDHDIRIGEDVPDDAPVTGDVQATDEKPFAKVQEVAKNVEV